MKYYWMGVCFVVPEFCVSDDTVMHLATGRGMLYCFGITGFKNVWIRLIITFVIELFLTNILSLNTPTLTKALLFYFIIKICDGFIVFRQL